MATFYPIIDASVCAARGLSPAVVVDACLRGGALLLQLRWKSGSSGGFLSLADQVVGAARASGAQVIVNDRADIAVMSGAAGVHIGQHDLAVEDVLAMPGMTGQMIVGLSTHDRRQIDEAVEGPATYIAVGPVFGTATKDTGYDARGLSLVSYAAGRGKPVVAIGGITLDRARAVVEAGASAVAVIGDLFAEGDIEARVRAFVTELPARPFNV